jgi:hypothetical protein
VPGRGLVGAVEGLPGSGWSGGGLVAGVGLGGFEGFEETEAAVARLVGRVRAAVAGTSSLAVLEAGVREGCWRWGARRCGTG